MKKIIYFSIFSLMVTVTCCNTKNPNENNKVPDALQEKSYLESFSKRGGENLVDKIYYDILEKDSKLKTIDNQINNATQVQNDSTNLFLVFNDKNQTYYSSANTYIEAISDSILREKLRKIITKSITNYDTKIKENNELLNLISSKTSSLNDLHIILKLTKTLPVIEKYQNENISNKKSMENAIILVDKTIVETEKYVKK